MLSGDSSNGCSTESYLTISSYLTNKNRNKDAPVLESKDSQHLKRY